MFQYASFIKQFEWFLHRTRYILEESLPQKITFDFICYEAPIHFYASSKNQGKNVGQKYSNSRKHPMTKMSFTSTASISKLLK